MSNQFHVHTDTHPYGLALPWALAGIYWKRLSWGVLQRWFDLIVSIVWILFTFRWTWDRLEITQQQVEETSRLENRRYILYAQGAARGWGCTSPTSASVPASPSNRRCHVPQSPGPQSFSGGPRRPWQHQGPKWPPALEEGTHGLHSTLVFLWL